MEVAKISMHTPGLEELQAVLDSGLRNNFTDVSVSVVECPDLTQPPFRLASPGICGNARLVDVGGPHFVLPLVRRDKIYHSKKIAEAAELPNALLIGAGAGPIHVIGLACELMNNLKYNADGSVINNTYIAYVDPKTKRSILEKKQTEEFCLFGNFLLSDGLPGKVIEMKVSKRHGSESFSDSIRKALGKHYGDKPVAMGGTFYMEKGRVHTHMMPEFSKTPLTTHEAIQEWLIQYDMDTPVVCVGTLVSHDPGHNLWLQHFHFYSEHGEGAHYDYDITPDEVTYHGYFSVAESIYRIDPPPPPASE